VPRHGRLFGWHVLRLCEGRANHQRPARPSKAQGVPPTRNLIVDGSLVPLRQPQPDRQRLAEHLFLLCDFELAAFFHHAHESV
jgi:hypothetical protein